VNLPPLARPAHVRGGAPRAAVALFAALLLVATCGGPAPSATPPPGSVSPVAVTHATSAPPSAYPSPVVPSVTSPSPGPSAVPSTSLPGITVSTALGRTTSGPFSRPTKVPALGQPVTWRFQGGPDLAGQTLQVQSLTSLRPVVWTTIATVIADPDGVATYTTSFDQPAFLSLRALVPPGPGTGGGVSGGLQASWRGTGPCPVVAMAPGPVTYEGPVTTSPDGTRYQVVGGPDAAGDQQSTLVVSGSAGTLWRHAFTPCYGVTDPVLDAAGTAYLVATLQTFHELDSAIFAFGPAGIRSRTPYSLAGVAWSLFRSPLGTVYAEGASYTLGTGGTLIDLRRSYLAALDASGHPTSGWPYGTSVPLSEPTFGSDGTAYMVAGFVIGVSLDLGVHEVLALAPDGTSRVGWPFRLPAGVGPLHTGMGEGQVAVGEPPVVGPDGTIYVAAGKGAWGSGGDLVYTLRPDGHVKPGWPYATVLSDGALLSGATGGSPGALPPVPGSDGTLYLATRAGAGATIHDAIVALDSDGHVRAGWPHVLSAGHGIDGAACTRDASGSATFRAGECWLAFAAGGILRVGVSGGGSVGEACLRRDGTAVSCAAG
jgi:hypothetical protein